MNDNNKLVEVTASRLNANGDGLAVDHDGARYIVPGLLKGETALVRVRRRIRSQYWSQVVEILNASPGRVRAPCSAYAEGCGGCQLQHLSLSQQRESKLELIRERFAEFGDGPSPDEIEVVGLEPWRFRTSLRLAVDSTGVACFRKRRTHHLVTGTDCEIAHPLLRGLMTIGRFHGAEEVTLRCGARTGERLAVSTPQVDHCNVPNDVRGDFIHELAANRRWRISAGSFFQSRPDAIDQLASLVVEAADEVDGPKVAVDLYSGVGVFAGVLADHGWSVTAVESVDSAVEDARANLSKDDVKLMQEDVGRWRPSRANLVVADPNRIGIGPDGRSVIAAIGAQRVVLISCDISGLVNDSRLLRQAGYSLKRMSLVDVFPHTFRVEVVSIFDKT